MKILNIRPYDEPILNMILKAEEIIKTAEIYASNIIKETNEQKESIKLEAHKIGYQEGLAKGVNSILSLKAEKACLLEEMKDYILDLVEKISSAILGEAFKSEEISKNFLSLSLQRLMNEKPICKLSADDKIILLVPSGKKTLVENKLQELKQVISVEENNTILENTYSIKTNRGSFEASPFEHHEILIEYLRYNIQNDSTLLKFIDNTCNKKLISEVNIGNHDA